MWKRRTREENEVLWGVWRAAVHSRLVLIIRVPSDTPGLILSGLWLKIFVNSHLWFIASQKKKKRKKESTSKPFFCILCVCVCVCMWQILFLPTQVCESLNRIYSSNGGFMAVNNMLRALTLLFFKWRKHFFGSMNLVEVCSSINSHQIFPYVCLEFYI